LRTRWGELVRVGVGRDAVGAVPGEAVVLREWGGAMARMMWRTVV
jgi:hypothetical protein